MSQEAVKEFLKKVGEDEELTEKVKEAGTDVNELIRLGKECGCEFTPEDMKLAHEEHTKRGEELSDEDLEKVAGGFVTSVAAAVAAGAASAAAALVGAGAAVATAAGAPGKK